MTDDDAQQENPEYYRIALRGEEGDYPALSDVALFLYHFNVLYDFSRLLVDPKYAEFKFAANSANRNFKRVEPGDRLAIESLRVQSPIALTVVILATPASAAALWVLTQAFEKIVNFPINRKNLKLQNESLELGNEKTKLESDKLRRELDSSAAHVPASLAESDGSFVSLLHIRNAAKPFGLVMEKLESSEIRIREFEITRVHTLPDKSRLSGDGNS